MSNFRLIDRETGAQSVGDPSDMARKSVAAMQHDYGRILVWAVCSGLLETKSFRILKTRIREER